MQRSYFPTYDVFFDGVLDPGHVDRGRNQGLAVTLRMNISCICCDHIEKHVQARLIYRKSSQVNRTQKNMEQHKKHTDFHHTVDGRNAASAS